MKNSKSLKVKIVATVLASVCAVSALSAVAVSANDGMGRYSNNNAYHHFSQYSNDFQYECYGRTDYGYDWTYSIDSCNVTVNCDYNFSNNKYTFTVKGVKSGYVNAVLKYVNMQNQWVKVPMVFYVDNNLNVSRIDDIQKKNDSRYEQLKNIITRSNVSSYTVVKTHDDSYDKLVVTSKDEYNIMHYEFYRIENDKVTRLGSYGSNIVCYIDRNTARLGVARMDSNGCCYSGKLTATDSGIMIDWQNEGRISSGQAVNRHGSGLVFTNKNNLSKIEIFK